MNSRFAWAVFLVLMLVGASIVGFATPSTGDPTIVKIVSSMPRTGSAKAQTDTIVNGIKMAFEEANWMVGKYRIEYADWDDATAAAGQWTAEAEIRNARRAVRHPNVVVYIGTYNSGAAKVAMPILNRARLLMLSPAATWPGLTKPGKGDPGEPDIYRPSGEVTFFRVLPADDLQGPLAAKWAKEMGVKSVFVLDDSEVYGKGIATLFLEHCSELGIQVLGHESIDAKAQEYKSLMTKIKALHPDLVYFGGTTQSHGGQVAKDMMSVGLDCKLMVPDACMEEAFITGALAANVNDRCYLTFGGLPPELATPAGKRFYEAYRKKFGKEPEGYAIYGYEAAKVALEAIRRADSKDREKIVEAARSIADFESGAVGRWSFDENGDTTLQSVSGNRVHDGHFEFVKMLGDQ